MAVIRTEWWMRAAARPQPEISIPNRLKQAAELMATNIGQIIWRLVDPPYPTADGKPLAVRFYKPGESPFTPEQIEQLTAVVKMFEEKT